MKKLTDVLFSTLEAAADWASGHSMWPLACGLSCCAIEMMHAAASRFDLDRFGCLFRASPRQADLMIIAGTVTTKMLPQLRTLYDQMLSPKYTIAMGSCAISGGLYAEHETVVSNLGKHIPIDAVVYGCPPTPTDLTNAILKLQECVSRRSLHRRSAM
ncbi:MAG: NADH-quinone oxidoreductase subunit NuoB [Holosporales bacterium]|jgi:NADH-quinone oxidoreductase subunit B|nr:NADH-quinone oxidoreductase subunit NuoB [Holosporales bacterium]